MAKKSILLIKILVILAATMLAVIAMARRIQQHNVEQQVMAVLADDNRMTRIETFARLRDTQGTESLAVLVRALDDPDDKIRSRAASALSLYKVGEIVPTLAEHLKSSPYPEVRLSCAIVLMSHKTPIVHDAYLHALRDSSDKVAQIACIEVVSGSRPGDAEVLFGMLDHLSWRVRLEVCKALIIMKRADNRVVTVLEAMSHTPEVARYDAEIEEFDRIDRETSTPDEMKGRWGKLDTILKQAQDLAANK